MSNFLLRDKSNGNERSFDSLSEVQDQAEELRELGADVEIIKPTSDEGTIEDPGPAEVVDMTDGGEEMVAVDECVHCGADIEDGHCPDCESEADVVDVQNAADQLPDEKPGVDTDPLNWVPSDFVDTIEGQPAINRKGYEVICQHYGVSVEPEMVESPSETDGQSCVHKATATTSDGTTYTAYGSAHVDRGDDKVLLVEMSDTRAYKRAASRATGVGMLAVEELQGASR